MPSRVVIDARKLGDGGIGVYIENLVDGLLYLRVSKLVLIATSKQQIPSRWKDNLEVVFDPAKKYSFSEYFMMPIRLKQVFADSLVHFPHYTVPFFMPKSSKIVVTIHDCIHLKSEHLLTRLFSRLMIGWALFKANRVITVSNYSKQSILRNFTTTTSELIDVIANNISPNLKVISAKQAEDYFLYVGNGKSHKGLNLALDAFDFLKLKSKLIVVGKNFSSKQLEQGSESVLFVGDCSTEQLSNLYANAKALIMPSLQEGFGIPALEALSYGLPVVATPAPSLVEWFGDSIWFADRFDAPALAETIKDLLADEKNRKRRIELGLALAKNFSVLNSAHQTLEAYQKVAPNFVFLEQQTVTGDEKFAKVV